ncbi:MAG: hypothetical protein ACON35_01040 [Candidatus Marinamargulisbacteria bacterium]
MIRLSGVRPILPTAGKLMRSGSIQRTPSLPGSASNIRAMRVSSVTDIIGTGILTRPSLPESASNIRAMRASSVTDIIGTGILTRPSLPGSASNIRAMKISSDVEKGDFFGKLDFVECNLSHEEVTKRIDSLHEFCAKTNGLLLSEHPDKTSDYHRDIICKASKCALNAFVVHHKVVFLQGKQLSDPSFEKMLFEIEIELGSIFYSYLHESEVGIRGKIDQEINKNPAQPIKNFLKLLKNLEESNDSPHLLDRYEFKGLQQYLLKSDRKAVREFFEILIEICPHEMPKDLKQDLVNAFKRPTEDTLRCGGSGDNHHVFAGPEEIEIFTIHRLKGMARTIISEIERHPDRRIIAFVKPSFQSDVEEYLDIVLNERAKEKRPTD